MESDKLPPEPMSSLIEVMTFLKLGLADWSAMIARHCSTGRPALIMVENWREKIATSLTGTLTFPPPGRNFLKLKPPPAALAPPLGGGPLGFGAAIAASLSRRGRRVQDRASPWCGP